MFLGNFDFDKRTIPWMLSTGTLGPFYSWDKRISLLPPDSSITLNKNNWSLNFHQEKPEFNEEKILTAAIQGLN